jgi:3-dehydroquinate dehydratase/shikimate dehydrogenase
VLAECEHLVEQGARLIELRLDYIRRQVDLKRLLANRKCPMIVTCRRAAEQGNWEGSEESRLMLLRAAIAEGVDYVDLEEDIAGSIPRYGKTKRIVSMHDFRCTPENLEEIHARLAGLDADIVKMATMANEPHDNVRMLQFVRQSKVPTVGICMGEIGTPSRILAGKFGAPFSYATFHHERALAPGQLSFDQMRQVYGYDQIDRDTRVYAVIGDPVANDLTHVILNAGFQALKINGVSIPLRLPREQLLDFLADCEDLDVRGLSVGSPHKEEVVRHLSHVDKVSDSIRAADTVLYHDDGASYGYNCDSRAAVVGLMKASGVKSDTALEGKRALVMGAGSVATAVVHGLAQAKVQVIVTSRTIARARDLADMADGRAVEWDSRYAVQADMVVNCTPVGMHPNVDETPYEVAHLKRNWLVCDMVYNPERTMFVKDARGQGCRVVTGVDTFVRHAAMQFKLFTDQSPPLEVMRSALRRVIGAAKL